MSAEWDDVPVIDSAAVSESGTCVVGGRNYFELGESGWFALLGWCAGTDHMLRVADTIQRFTRVRHRQGDQERTWMEARTASDQEAIDDDVLLHLSAVGAPARPGGFRWFLELPSGFRTAGEFLAAVNAAIAPLDLGTDYPAGLGRHLPGILSAMYAN